MMNSSPLELKKIGNKFAREKNYKEAINYYTAAIQKSLNGKKEHPYYGLIDHELAVLFSNRSQMYLLVHEYYKSFLDCLSVFECVIRKDVSTDVNFIFSTISLNIVVKTRLRIARIHCASSGNFSKAVHILLRTSYISILSEDQKKILTKEMFEAGGRFSKREHIFRNPEWEKRNDFNRFCVNVKDVREKFLRLDESQRKSMDGIHFQSFSKLGDRCFVFGGRKDVYVEQKSSRRFINYSNDLSMIDLSEGVIERIRQHGSIPEKRAQHRTVIHEESKTMYLYGGSNTDLSIDDNYIHPFYRLNLETFSWERLEFSLRDKFGRKLCLADHCMLILEDTIYIFGGTIRTESYDVFTYEECGDLLSYNVKTKVWKYVCKFDRNQHTRFPLPRYRAGMFEMNGRFLYLIAGEVCENSPSYFSIDGRKKLEEKIEDDQTCRTFREFRDCWRFDLKNEKWEKIIQTGCVPSRRTECYPVKFGDKVYIFGGFSYEPVIGFPPKRVVNNYTYFRDGYEFSLWRAEGNEMVAGNGMFKNTGHWRKMLFPKKYFQFNRSSSTTSTTKPLNDFISERSDVHLFIYKNRLCMYGGYRGGTLNYWTKEKSTFWSQIAMIRFEKMRECKYCLKLQEKMMKCGRCATHYCNSKCQLDDWKVHKLICRKKKE